MALYEVSHKRRKKSVEMDIFFNPNSHCLKRSQMDAVALGYKKLAGYSKFIDFRELIFKKKEIKNPPPKPKPSPINWNGACDKDWCDPCRRGNYDRCPNQH